jgi:hypothetical protein
MVHVGLNEWLDVAQANGKTLAELLNRCTAWESDVDPHAKEMPRAKRHDDKAIAVVRFDPARSLSR